jgi:uncharacterized protein (TIGR02117 family)
LAAAFTITGKKQAPQCRSDWGGTCHKRQPPRRPDLGHVGEVVAALRRDRMSQPRGASIGAAILMLLVVTLATAKGGDPALYPAKPGDGVAIYLLDNGFHTDLVLPRDAILQDNGSLADAAEGTTAEPWIMVGWGDERFYRATSPWQGRIGDGLRALLGGRPTVVHLEGVWGRPDLVWKTGVHRVVLSKAGLAALLQHADRAMLVSPSGGLIPIAHGQNEGFYRSGETFSLIHLCNHWAAEQLHAAGLPITPVLDLLPAGLILDLQLRAGLKR